MAQRTRSGCWPSHLDECLIKSALDVGGATRLHWDSWSSKTDLDAVAPETQRLLPLVYANLCAQSIVPSSAATLKGISRYHSAKNQMMLAELAKIIQLFSERGIDCMLLKGAALSVAYYDRVGHRPMSDCDLLVRPEQRDEAIALLSEAGCSPFKRFHKRMSLFGTHGFLFQLPNGMELDLHWFAISQNRVVGIDRGFWDRAVPVQLLGVQTKMLCPTDMLLHVIVHGLRWSDLPAIRWLVDSSMVLRRSARDIEWPLLLETAHSRKLTLPLAAGLTYLAEQFDAPIPGDVLRQLREQNPSWFERFDFRVRTLKQTAFTEVHRVWCDYVRLNPEHGSLGLALGFMPYLREKWGLERAGDVPLYLLQRRAKKLPLRANVFENVSSSTGRGR